MSYSELAHFSVEAKVSSPGNQPSGAQVEEFEEALALLGALHLAVFHGIWPSLLRLAQLLEWS